MERKIFNGLLKDLISHLYDLAAIETHPLTALLNPPAGYRGSRGEYIQELIQQEIKKLPPAGKALAPGAPEWRPYLILYRRYIEGLSPQVIASALAISERQLRRDHSRALQALAGRLWEQHFDKQGGANRADQDEAEPAPAFELHAEMLDLQEIADGAVQTMQARARAEEIQLSMLAAHLSYQVLADRVVLRQILFSLLNYAFYIQSERKIALEMWHEDEAVGVEIQFQADEHWRSWDADEHEDLLESAQYWARQIGASLEVSYPESGSAGKVGLRFGLKHPGKTTILVIEDQQPTLRMYQRYLVRSGFQVVGISEPNQAVDMAQQLQPALILLDVMMPTIDGWEILQSLKMDGQTNQIPVIVCSAWEAPEMARSLGAVEFLKKPVTRQMLLGMLARLNLTGSDKSVESLPEGL